jgi:hypothetical protein
MKVNDPDNGKRTQPVFFLKSEEKNGYGVGVRSFGRKMKGSKKVGWN